MDYKEKLITTRGTLPPRVFAGYAIWQAGPLLLKTTFPVALIVHCTHHNDQSNGASGEAVPEVAGEA